VDAGLQRQPLSSTFTPRRPPLHPPQKNLDDIGIAELLRFLPEGFTIPAGLPEIDIFEIDLKPPFEDLRSSQWPQSAA
jgi:hypothetical protein